MQHHEVEYIELPLSTQNRIDLAAMEEDNITIQDRVEAAPDNPPKTTTRGNTQQKECINIAIKLAPIIVFNLLESISVVQK